MVGAFNEFGVDVYKNPDDPGNSELTSKGEIVRIITNLSMITLNLPISLLKNLYSLRYMTIFSMTSLAYI